MAMNVKKGDTVIVLSGKDKGKQGKVLGTVPSEAKVVVEGINMVTCHVKPRKQGETGGIVQGMSGSPILQNGRLVGAVTHVLVNDPTRGYGIFAQTMLEQAEQVATAEK